MKPSNEDLDRLTAEHLARQASAAGMPELDDYIERASRLPPAPQILLQLIPLLNDPEVDTQRVVELIDCDPALAANVLQLCNSAELGGAQAITDIGEAVLRLGVQPLYRLAAAICGARLITALKPGWGVDRTALWKHSIATAIGAQLVARELGGDESAAYTAGLLHDVGRIVMACALEHIYGALVEEAVSQQCSLVETEKRRLGVHHGEVGGRLLTRWRFPAPLIAAVAWHHEPGGAQADASLAAGIWVGDMTAYVLGYAAGAYPFSFQRRDEVVQRLGLGPDRLPWLLTQTLETAQMAEFLFRFGG